MRRRLRILFVSPFLPQPLNSGTNIRIRHLLEAMIAAGDVHWLGYGTASETAEFDVTAATPPPWWTSCASMRSLPAPPRPNPDGARFKRLVQLRPLSGRPHLFARYPIESLRQMVARVQPEMDLVWVERLYTAYRLGVPREKCIIDIDDLESVKVQRQAEIEPRRYMGWALRREARRLAAVEAGALDQLAARLTVCSELDASGWPDSSGRVWVVPNGTDDALFERPTIPKIEGRLVFVGTMGYWANEDAVTYFIEQMFPRIVQRRPAVSLAIVGRSPPARIRRLHDGARVFVHADVADVAPYVQQAALSIVPLRVGGGTRLKILESLALGTAVVSTTIGAEGLDLCDGTDLLLADSPDTFASAVERLLLNDEERTQLARNGAKRVSEIYRWSQIRKTLSKQVGAFAETLQAQTHRVNA